MYGGFKRKPSNSMKWIRTICKQKYYRIKSKVVLLTYVYCSTCPHWDTSPNDHAVVKLILGFSLMQHIQEMFDGIASASKLGSVYLTNYLPTSKLEKVIQIGSSLQICNLGNSNFDKQWQKDYFYRGKILQIKRLIKIYSVLNNFWTIHNYSFPLFTI